MDTMRSEEFIHGRHHQFILALRSRSVSRLVDVIALRLDLISIR